jgi:hypothetical protein
MLAAGARISWVPDAVVEEPTPQKRLTLGYHYRRARDQATNWVTLNNKPAPRSLFKGITRVLTAPLMLLAVPVTGRYGIVRAVHKMGMGVGFIRGVLGGRSRHYDAGAAQFHTERN